MTHWKVITALLILSVTAAPAHIMAQDEAEYLMEIGPAAGGCFYMGDANSRLYRGTRLMGGAVLRYNVNPRLSVKATMTAGGISGSTFRMEGRSFPDDFSFRRTIYDFGFQVECNFLAYGTTTYNGCHRLAPYYLAGAGVTFAPEPARNDFAANFPIGIGVKYKLAPRLNAGLEFTMRFSTSDRLDVTGTVGEDPLHVKSGFMKNKDSYSYTMLTLTYDIYAKPCNCN